MSQQLFYWAISHSTYTGPPVNVQSLLKVYFEFLGDQNNQSTWNRWCISAFTCDSCTQTEHYVCTHSNMIMSTFAECIYIGMSSRQAKTLGLLLSIILLHYDNTTEIRTTSWASKIINTKGRHDTGISGLICSCVMHVKKFRKLVVGWYHIRQPNKYREIEHLIHGSRPHLSMCDACKEIQEIGGRLVSLTTTKKIVRKMRPYTWNQPVHS